MDEPTQRIRLLLGRGAPVAESRAELGNLRYDVRLRRQGRLRRTSVLKRNINEMKRLGRRLAVANIVRECCRLEKSAVYGVQNSVDACRRVRRGRLQICHGDQRND